jgi:carboxymethylenebutenolidase
MNRAIIALYDEYTHTPLDRRTFLDRLAKLAGSTAAATALLPLLEADYAHAAVVAEDDSRLAASDVSVIGSNGSLAAYLAAPSGDAKHPAAIVIHENRGLNPHIKDVTRRLALAGFVGLAPDLLSPLGGTPADEDTARDLIGQLDPAQTLADASAALDHLRTHPRSTGKVGCIGFCWGGGLAGQLAASLASPDATVVFYGRPPEPDQVLAIRAPLLLHYAGLDERINAGVPGFEAALKSAGADYTLYIYAGVDHAFHNDTNAARYNEAAAKLAWQRTIDFLQQRLAS